MIVIELELAIDPLTVRLHVLVVKLACLVVMLLGHHVIVSAQSANVSSSSRLIDRCCVTVHDGISRQCEV